MIASLIVGCAIALAFIVWLLMRDTTDGIEDETYAAEHEADRRRTEITFGDNHFEI